MLEDILKNALEAEYGLAVKAPNLQAANRLRRQFYICRELLRRKGCNDFDGLSFISKPDGELWIIQRQTATYKDTPDYSIRSLRIEELPNRILSRGKHKTGLFAMMELAQLIKPP